MSINNKFTLVQEESIEPNHTDFIDNRVYLLRLEVGHLVSFDGVTYQVKAINDYGIDISRLNSNTLLRIDVVRFTKCFETVKDIWSVNYYN